MILKDICVLFIINSNQPAQNSVFCKISVFAQHWSPHGARFLGAPGTISPPKPARIEWFTSADGGWSRQHFDEIKGNFIVGLRVRKRWFWSAWQCTCSSRQSVCTRTREEITTTTSECPLKLELERGGGGGGYLECSQIATLQLQCEFLNPTGGDSATQERNSVNTAMGLGNCDVMAPFA